MPIQSRANIKSKFQQYDRPEQTDYHNWIDSFIHKAGEDGLTIDENGRLGIGTTTPERALHIRGTGGISDDVIIDSRGNTNSGAIVFFKSRAEDNPVREDDSLGLLSWRGYTGTEMIQSCGIQAFSGATPGTGALSFFTRSSGGTLGGIKIDENGNVGIGTNSPEARLDVNGAIRFLSPEDGTMMYFSTNKSGSPTGDGFRLRFDGNFFGTNNDAIIFEKTDGNQSDPDGGFAFVNTGSDGVSETAMVIKGNGNIGIGTIDPSTKLHIRGVTTTSSLITSNIVNTGTGAFSRIVSIGNNDGLVMIGGGFEGPGRRTSLIVINDTQLNQDLQVSGEARKPGGGDWASGSDSRIKEDVKDFRDGLEKLKKLRPVTYKYNGKGGSVKNDQIYHGFIAQEVEKVCPYMVGKYKAKLNDEDEHETELLSLNTSPLEYLLVNGLMELDKRLAKLENK